MADDAIEAALDRLEAYHEAYWKHVDQDSHALIAAARAELATMRAAPTPTASIGFDPDYWRQANVMLQNGIVDITEQTLAAARQEAAGAREGGKTDVEFPQAVSVADGAGKAPSGDVWQPIETAPMDGTPLLLFARSRHATASVIVSGWYLQEEGWVECAFAPNRPVGLVPSHWQHKPPFTEDRE